MHHALQPLKDPRTGTWYQPGDELPADFPGLSTLLMNGGARPGPAPATSATPLVITPAEQKETFVDWQRAVDEANEAPDGDEEEDE